MALSFKEKRALQAEFKTKDKELSGARFREKRALQARMREILELLFGEKPGNTSNTPTYDALKRGDYNHATPDAFKDAIMKAAGELGIGEMDDPKDLAAISQNWAMINYGNAA